MKKFLFGITILFLVSALKGQSIEFEKRNFPGQKDQFKLAMKNLKEGEKLIEDENFINALPFLMEAQKFNPNNAPLNYYIGVCHLYSYQKHLAASYFEKAIQLDPKVSFDVHFLLGQSYHYNGAFEKAIQQYEIFKSGLTPEEMLEYREDVEKKIKECLTGKELTKNHVRVFKDNLPGNVNSQFDEYSPIINADESIMLFTSRRPNSTGGKKAVEDHDFYEDIFISYNQNGVWSSPVNPGKPLNDDLHDATVGISPDGQRVLIYRNEDIYESFLMGEDWARPKNLGKPICMPDSHEPSACYSPDGRAIYFVSNRSGGYGGLDIYVSRMTDPIKEKWSTPVNLGPEINTEYDEDGVFIHPDGKTLYFSSNGHKTMGGFDLFKSTFENGKWGNVENLGYPINGAGDDRFLVLSADGKRGYISSQEESGKGGADIFLLTFLGPEKQLINNTEHQLLASSADPIGEKIIEKTVEIKTIPLTILKGMIFDETSKQPVKANIELIDNEENKILAVFTSNSFSGKYLVSLPAGKNYGIAIKADGYLFHSENFVIPLSSVYQEVVKDIALKKVEIGKKIVLRNIFFDSGKSNLRPESYAELGILRNLLIENPSLKIEISGHTDNVGSDALNQKLSEDRAKAVVDYLIGQGIDPVRLRYAGYGSTRPIASNDTEAGKQANRRTEFEIIER